MEISGGLENSLYIIKQKKTKKMQEKTQNLAQTEIVVVLDRSGSMASILESTIQGFNTFLNEQKNAEGEAYMTLVQFDDRYEIDYKSKPIAEVEELIAGVTFKPRGTTALLDAIGKTINELETTRDVIFVIITDGEENASKEYKHDAIKKIIADKEASGGWKILYLGANQDAIKVGASFGVSAGNAMSFGTSDEAVKMSYMSFSDNITNYRSAKFRRSEGMEADEVTLDSLADLSATMEFNDIQRGASK
jgi:hypothetical protein